MGCKEIWVEGADCYRNTDDDVPKDFAAKRVDYYQASTTRWTSRRLSRGCSRRWSTDWPVWTA
jgi:hypothetical protein